MALAFTTGGGSGSAGTVTSVSSTTNGIAVANGATTPALTLATLDVIAVAGPPAADWSNNSKKITSVANGSAPQDAAAFGQIPAALPPSGAAGGDLAGTYPNPTIGAAKVTVAKLAAAVTLDAIAAANATAADVSLASHKLTNVTDPSAAQDAATKNYVDAVALGLAFKQPCDLGTVAALPTNAYANGAAGVGATLIATAFGALSVDGTAVTVGQRILVKNEAAASHNGIYTVTATGGAAAFYTLTRATDFNQSSEIQAGDAVFVDAGATLADTLWVQTTTGTITVGTTAIAFSQLGTTPSLASVLAVGNSAGAKITNLTNGSAASDAAAFGQIPTTFDPASATHAATSKATPVDADELPLTDSAASFALKKLTWANVKATLKTYFDTLYVSSTGAVTSVFARTGAVVAVSGDYLASQVTNAGDKISTSIQSFAAGIVSTHATQGIGYATGAGGTVTQNTNKATGVTLNKASGQITMNNGALTAGATVSFTVTNSAYNSNNGDTVVLSIAASGSSNASYSVAYENSSVAGAFRVRLTNISAGTLVESVIVNFTIIKGATS